MRKTTKIEGIDYVLDPAKRTVTYRPGRRKPTSEEIERRVAFARETQRISDELRAAVGLEPVPENSFRRALFAEAEKREK